jgi:hypothetical protein
MWMTESRGMLYEESVEVGWQRCLPACTRRRSVEGMLVRSERRVERVEIVVFDGRVSGIVLPCTFLTNIWTVSSLGSEAVEEAIEDTLELRRMMAMCVVGMSGW